MFQRRRALKKKLFKRKGIALTKGKTTLRNGENFSQKVKKSLYRGKRVAGQIERKWKFKNQRLDFTLVIQVNSSALEIARKEWHALTCEPKPMCLKDQWNVSMMGMVVNALAIHYFCNSFMTFPLLLMVEFDNDMSTETLKDF